MKLILIRMALIALFLGSVSCTDVEDRSFSELVRDAFNQDENDHALYVDEGIDFQFEEDDEHETFSDLLAEDD